MTESKYIITIFGAPVIFDPAILHSDLRVEAISAGFVRFWFDNESNRFKALCYGESTSLGISSHPHRDVFIVERFLNSR